MEQASEQKYLYKYCCWNEYRRRILTDNEIYFTSPAEFNDPFDCKIPIRLDKVSHDELVILLREVKPELSLNAEQIARWLENYGILKDDHFVSKIIDWQRQYMSKRLGIFSVSEINDNILMWSHYSNSHSGLCIGFNKNLLDNFLIQQKCKSNKMVEKVRVVYETNYPLLRMRLDKPEEATKRAVSVKASDWCYEREFRYIMMDGANEKIALDIGIISSIILGCKIQKEVKSEIINILKHRDDRIDLFQAIEKDENFGLDFNKTNY